MKQANRSSQETTSDSTSTSLCALQKAYDIQKACASVGFDWPDVGPVFDKVIEEIEELKAEVYCAQQQSAKIEDELGDVLFSVVNLSRHLNIKPDVALAKAHEKFVKRFSLVESFAAKEGTTLNSLNIDELEILWQRAKKGKGA